ncbi:MAG TPA: ANTAR domain-containing protein [Clostridiales bacterium]|nr:ANTAR domain-containing protein [Clostridiales bacterium]
MKYVLIVSKSEKTIVSLHDLLQQEGYCQCMFAHNTEQAKEHISNNEFDLIVISTPIEDGAGLDLSVYMIDHTRAGVFLLTGEDTLERVGEKLQQRGVFTLAKPVSRVLFHQSIRVWQATKNRIDGLERENEKLKLQVEEIKIIHRAKCTLMQCLAMSEPQAHRYLEKQAMDMRQSKRKVAEQVLNTYEA